MAEYPVFARGVAGSRPAGSIEEALVTQLAEYPTFNRTAAGSSPAGSTKKIKKQMEMRAGCPLPGEEIKCCRGLIGKGTCLISRGLQVQILPAVLKKADVAQLA